MTVRLTRRPLSVTAALASLAGRELGAVVVFAGRVRPDRVAGGRVTRLDYEVDVPIARRELGRLEAGARRRFGAQEVVLWHRLGPVRVGEISVVTGVACGHRAPAFAAARYLIEELKHSVPIWKTERARPSRRPRRPPSRRPARSSG